MWRSFWRRWLQAEPSTDDDCDSDSKHSQSYRERRREAHTAAEQKRRDAIKKGYDTLQELVPTCTQVSSCFISESVCLAMIDLITFISLQTDASGHKVSKAVVLQKSIDFIQHLSKQKKSQENDLTSLRKEVNSICDHDFLSKHNCRLLHFKSCVPITSSLWEPTWEHRRFLKIWSQMRQSFRCLRFSPDWKICWRQKFQVFQVFMDSLFQSFNQQVSMNNFAELSGCVFSWIEERCKPGDLQVR